MYSTSSALLAASTFSVALQFSRLSHRALFFFLSFLSSSTNCSECPLVINSSIFFSWESGISRMYFRWSSDITHSSNTLACCSRKSPISFMTVRYSNNKIIRDQKGYIQILMGQLKKCLFSLGLTFEANTFTNSFLLLLLDLSQVLALHCFYINPYYTHIRQLSFFSLYFSRVYPNFYLFKAPHDQNLTFNVISIVILPFAFLLLTLGKKFNITIIIYASQFIFLLFPLVILRYGAEVVEVFHHTLQWKVIGMILVVLGLCIGVVVLYFYKKLIKITDFVVAVLFSLSVNQYGIMGVLGLRLLVIWLIGEGTRGKKLKFYYELCLYISMLLMMVVPEKPINYFVFLCFVLFSIVTESFSIYCSLAITDIEKGLASEEDKGRTQQTMNEIAYFRKIEQHRSVCMLLECDCQSLSTVSNPAGLHAWAKNFRKQELRIRDDFESRIEYGRVCLNNEVVDFSGLVYLLRTKPTSLKEEFEWHCVRVGYQSHLRNLNSKEMASVGGQERYLREEALIFECKLVSIIKAIIMFWNSIVEGRNSRECTKTVLQISESINELTEHYEKIVAVYDEPLEIEFYYAIFRKLVLRRPKSEYIAYEEEAQIVSKGEKIVQASQKACRLLERSKSEIVQHPYTKFMPQAYAENHRLWVQEYEANYPAKEENSRKLLLTAETIIKVVEMDNHMIPRFEDGVLFLSKFSEKNEGKFYFLVRECSLEVVGYDDQFFKKMKIPLTESLRECIKYKSISEYFPNINRESIGKCKDSFRPQVKLNLDYVYSMAKSARSRKVTFEEIQEQKLFIYTTLKLNKSEELGFVLLEFEKSEESTIHKRAATQTANLTTVKMDDPPAQPTNSLHSFTFIMEVMLILTSMIMVGLLVIFEVHVWVSVHGIKQYQHRILYFQYSVESCVFFMGIDIGSQNRTPELKTLWLEGYGASSAIFTVFEQMHSESTFNGMFYENVITNQRQLYHTIIATKQQQIAFIRGCERWATVLMSLMVVLCVIELILSIISIIRMETEINEIIHRISLLPSDLILKFLTKFQKQAQFLSYEPDLEVDEGPVLETSLRSIMQHSVRDLKPEKKKTQRVLPLKENPPQSNSQYSRFCEAVVSSLLLLGIGMSAFLYTRYILTNSQILLQASTDLLLEPSILLQKFEEHHLNTTLAPSLFEFSFGQRQHVHTLPHNFDQFKEMFDRMSTGDICQYVSNCEGDIYGYGLQTVYQYLEEEFRSPSSKAHDQLVRVLREALELRNQKYCQIERQYLNEVRSRRVWMWPLLLLGVCVGVCLQLVNIGRISQNITKTINLFAFVPDKIKQKITL